MGINSTYGWNIVYDTGRIKHIFDMHGDNVKEATQGHIGVDPKMLADSARVFDNPDTFYWLDGTNLDGNRVFELTKRVDGVYYVATAYKSGKSNSW